jgi:hypothetical protein
MKIESMDKDQTKLLVDVDLHDNCLMDVEMSIQGAYTMLASVRDDVRDLNDLAANLNNQLERVQVKDISWC